MLKTILPITIQQAILSINFIIDNFMVGTLGELQVAALGSSNKFMIIIRMALIAISSVGSSLTAQFFGHKDNNGIKGVLIMNICINFGLILIFLVIYFTNKNYIISSFSDSQEIVTMCGNYLDIMIFTSITFGIIMPLITLLRNTGHILSSLMVSIISLITNYLLNKGFIYGNYGFPKLGLTGVAVSSVISELISIILLLILVYLVTKDIIMTKAKITYKKAENYLKLSLPLLSGNLLSSLSLVLSHNLMGQMGPEELSAFGVVSAVESILIDLFAGIGIASLALIGVEIGKKRLSVAFRKTVTILVYSAAVSVLITPFFFFVTRNFLTNFFNLSEEAYSHILNMLKLLGIFLASKTFNVNLSNGILASGGLFMMFTTIFIDWALVIPSIYIGFYLYKWHISSIYFLTNIPELILSAILFWRLRSKKWLHNLTDE